MYQYFCVCEKISLIIDLSKKVGNSWVYFYLELLCIQSLYDTNLVVYTNHTESYTNRARNVVHIAALNYICSAHKRVIVLENVESQEKLHSLKKLHRNLHYNIGFSLWINAFF
jgi:hypothetical protein